MRSIKKPGSDLVVPTVHPEGTASNNGFQSDIYHSEEDSVRLRDYWRSIRKHFKLIIAMAALITTLASIYFLRKPDIFQAQARVQVDLETTSPSLASKSGSFIFNSPVNDPAYF